MVEIATLWVPGELPGMNETIAAAKSGRGKGNAYARMKKAHTEKVAWLAKAARLPRMQGRIRLHCTWVARERRRDPDNISAAKKYVCDGLVAAGVLEGDGWKHVAAFSDEFTIGDQAGVYVTIQAA